MKKNDKNPGTLGGMKMFVVVRFTGGKFKIWPDYGDIAWGSPAYEVLGYFDSHKDARQFVQAEKRA